MIVWGGYSSGLENTGGRYSPSTDTWGAATSTSGNVPTARFGHTAAWTGSVMIVWGGDVGVSCTSSGGRYDPATDIWGAPTSQTGVPVARFSHSAVWNGSQMIVWGGRPSPSSCNELPDGMRYDPALDAWGSPTSQQFPFAAAFFARHGHSAVWTGSEMIVWGGLAQFCGDLLNNGGRYCGCPGVVAYPDADGDGYGDPSSGGTTICPGQPGYVANSLDCDDTDPTVHPGAPDATCDGVDNNCNGMVDEGAGGCACVHHANGLVGWWEGELNTDDATGSNDGAWDGLPAYAPLGEVGLAFAIGGGYVQIPDSPLLEFTKQFTLECWVYPTTMAGNNSARIVSKFGVGGSFAYELLIDSNASLLARADISDDGTNYDGINDVTSLAVNAWSHLATTFDAGVWRLYVNGVRVASKVSPITSIYSGGSTGPAIGALPGGGQFFSGDIDEVGIYSRALSASEVRAIYHAGSSGMCGAGTVAVDGPGPGVRSLAFAQPWPNPSARITNVEYQLPIRENVRAEVEDVTGRRVALLEDRVEAAGPHRLQWDGRDASGHAVAPGVYLVWIAAGKEAAAHRVVVMQ